MPFGVAFAFAKPRFFTPQAWWSAHPNESLDAFERAYGTYSSEGNTRRAAYVALRLAFEHADRSEPALLERVAPASHPIDDG